MKTLSSYIRNKNFDYIDDSIIKHYEIYNAFNNILEYYTFESLGLFNNCKIIVNYILDTVKKQNIKNLIIISDEINNLSNKFFNEIHISFSENKENTISGEYIVGFENENKNDEYQKKRWNKDLNIFNFIEIKIYNYVDGNYDDLAEILTHELTHAWDDFILFKHGYSSIKHILPRNKKFEKLLIDISSKIRKDKYNAVINNDSYLLNKTKEKLEYIDYLKNLFYYLDKFEINAYIAQINALLNSKEFDNVNDCMNYIVKNSVTYNNYKVLYDFINNEQYIDKIKDLGVSNKIISKYKVLSKKAINKIINHTYLICVDHINNIKVNHKDNLISITEKMKKIYLR